MRGLIVVIVLLAVALCGPGAASPRVGLAPPRVAEETAGITATVVGNAVAAGAARAPITVVAVEEMSAIAKRGARAGLVCDVRDASCAARLAAFSGLDFVVVSEVAGVGDALRAELALVDGRDGRVTRTRSAPLDADAIAAGVEATTLALLLDGPVRGRLDVRGPTGAAIDVDGAIRGSAPLRLDVEAGLRLVNGKTVRVPAAAGVIIDDVGAVGEVGGVGGDGGGSGSRTPLDVAALSTVGVGMVLGLAGGIGAVVVAPDPARRDDVTARAWNDAVSTGRGLVVVAVVGAGLVAAGGGLWLARDATP